MAIFRGIGGAGDSTTDATVTAVTEQAVNAAESAAASAASVSEAASSASAAASSASDAATSKTGADTSASNAATSAAAAASSASAAATSETNAAASETAAAASETAAASSASDASTSATGAASSASAAATSATNAASSATSSANSATASAASAAAALVSENAAAASQTAAASSASAAATSASSASASADAALAALDSFDDRYLGQKSSDPALDNDGNALVAGALYFNTTDSAMKVYDGTVWLSAYASLSGALLTSNNLNDLSDASTSRTNLGVAIGSDVQAYNADTVIDASYVHTDNNYTTPEKSKLAGIADGAEVNVNADWAAVSGDALILNKPTAVSAFTNDAGYITSSDSITGNAATATKLATARSIGLSGDVSGSVSFDGSADATITAVVADDSHNHIIDNVDGLQTALDAKQPIDADLTAIAALVGTSGLLKKTDANTWTLDTSAYSTTTGTVTSVSGTGSYGGLSLSGSVTSSGDLTFGGTPTGTWPISVSGNAATATTASQLTTSNWTVVESAGVLYFQYGGVNKAKIDSSGNLTVTGNITAYGSV